MRTREEQIAALAFEIDGVQAKEATKRYVEQHLVEAERRAEQRVRAEIARDSERLDWLADHQCQFLNEGLGKRPLRTINDCMGDPIASDYDLRKAIDAAREVG